MMKKPLILMASLLVLGGSAAATDQTEALNLAKKSGCLACHALDKKMVGPAWNEVGAKYAADPAAERERLITAVKKGSKGVWGAVPMPGNVTVKDADVAVLVDFVLSLGQGSK